MMWAFVKPARSNRIEKESSKVLPIWLSNGKRLVNGMDIDRATLRNGDLNFIGNTILLRKLSLDRNLIARLITSLDRLVLRGGYNTMLVSATPRMNQTYNRH